MCKKDKKYSKFGQPNKPYLFLREPTFDNVVLPVLKSSYCLCTDISVLRAIYPLYDHLCIYLLSSISIDFTTLLHNDPEWESPQSIPFSKKMKLLACSLYFNFNIPQMIRYLGGQYTGDDQNVVQILQSIKGLVPVDTFAHVERILTTGVPAVLHGYSSVKKFLEYWRCGNHILVNLNRAKIEKVMNKEDKHRYLLPLPCWLARFIPNLHISPQGLIIKLDKNDRLVFDASYLIKFYSICSNMMTTPSL